MPECALFFLLVVLKRTSDAAVAADRRSGMSLVVAFPAASSYFPFVWVRRGVAHLSPFESVLNAVLASVLNRTERKLATNDRTNLF